MSKKTERQIEIRAEMTQLLIELSPQSSLYPEISNPSDDVRLYAIIIITLFAAVFVRYVGPQSSNVIVATALLGIILGLLLLLADKFSLAAKVRLVEGIINDCKISIK